MGKQKKVTTKKVSVKKEKVVPTKVTKKKEETVDVFEIGTQEVKSVPLSELPKSWVPVDNSDLNELLVQAACKQVTDEVKLDDILRQGSKSDKFQDDKFNELSEKLQSSIKITKLPNYFGGNTKKRDSKKFYDKLFSWKVKYNNLKRNLKNLIYYKLVSLFIFDYTYPMVKYAKKNKKKFQYLAGIKEKDKNKEIRKDI